MFPKFIQVGLYLGERLYGRGAYIRDAKWVTYLGSVYSRGAYMWGDVLIGFYGMLDKK